MGFQTGLVHALANADSSDHVLEKLCGLDYGSPFGRNRVWHVMLKGVRQLDAKGSDRLLCPLLIIPRAMRNYVAAYGGLSHDS